LTFRGALQFGYVGRLECRAYLDWVKTLECCCGCGQPADDPHHPKLMGFAVASSKVPDWWVIPLTRACHDALHSDVELWERRYGLQIDHILMTLTRALWAGVLKFDGR